MANPLDNLTKNKETGELEDTETFDFDIDTEIDDLELDDADTLDGEGEEELDLADEIRGIVKAEIEMYFADDEEEGEGGEDLVPEFDENGEEIIKDEIIIDAEDRGLIDEGFINDLMWKLSKHDKPTDGKSDRTSRKPPPNTRTSREMDTKQTKSDHYDAIATTRNKYGRTPEEEAERDRKIGMSKSKRVMDKMFDKAKGSEYSSSRRKKNLMR